MDLNSYKYQRIHDLKLAEGICVAAVVKVLKFDPAKMTVNVQPLSKHLENGKYESQPLRIAAASSSAPGSSRGTPVLWSTWTTTWMPP